MRPLTADRRYPDAPRARAPQPGYVPQAAYTPAPRRDPAPTRMAYRMQRLWLTPAFRVLMRVGVPVLCVAAVGAIAFGPEARRNAIFAQVGEWRQAIENRPEFRVSVLQVTGASPSLDAAIREMLDVKLPVSRFAIDLEAAATRIRTLDAVAQAEVKVGSGGVLSVQITERKPALIWRKEAELDLLDASGRRVAQVLERADRPDLPVVTGLGADKAAAEALAIVAAAKPVLPRLRGLVRIGERRWDLVLDRDQRILLPADNPVRALERLLALDKAEDLLGRDIIAVDLRNQARPTIRLSADALRSLRRAKGLETVENAL
ncbi:MAG: cell division protein FtsQ [Rhodobacterales bacterium 65-51]|uniref:cell division protein FtsQ/DivIB n=1 Tax=uncultured Gemmobacter sp. TaxID=1095917 RepID=UPI0009661766|nr:cell division protein FtsQ/DivIB [uncultured Gemmobacter sp.]OJY33676.1 MAG: cell division protein FtsQ [Rhodobacterales bacterium 65-51]